MPWSFARAGGQLPLGASPANFERRSTSACITGRTESSTGSEEFGELRGVSVFFVLFSLQ
jgi:hypothetical protein